MSWGRRAIPMVVVVAMLLTVSFYALLHRHVSVASAAPHWRPHQDNVRSNGDLQKIQHIVFIMQENRSFDSYFGTFPGADGIPVANGTPTVCVPDPRTGQCVYPFHSATDVHQDEAHDPYSAIGDIDGGKMDGFIKEYYLFCAFNPCTGSANQVMGYHDAREITNYWTYAQQFVLHDHMFAPNISYSLPSHLAMVSAWTADCGTQPQPHSCTSSLSPPAVLDLNPTPVTQARPIYSWTDITYLLHQHGVSWAYYVGDGTQPSCPGTGPYCTPPPGGPQLKTGSIEYWNPLPLFQTVQQDNQVGNIQGVSNFYTAAANGTLPAVSWIVPTSPLSEHPPNPMTDGQAYVTKIINTIMQGPEWQNTAIFLAWDDWGGFYDHVNPPVVDSTGYGMRVPSLVISAYAKQGYVDHQILSFDAYLKFIEDVFLGGQRLDPATDGRPDGRPDVRENLSILGNLANDFDFTQSPRPPLLLNPYPPSPTPTPAPQATLAATPNIGGYGQAVTLVGAGFAANEAVSAYWDSTSSPALATAQASASGAFSATLSVPSAISGTHTLIAVGQISGQSGQAAFTVAPRIVSRVASGPAGITTTLAGTGFGANEAVTAWWGAYKGPRLGTTQTNALGAFAASTAITFTVPLSPTGTYPIVAAGQFSGASAHTPFTITTPSSNTASVNAKMCVDSTMVSCARRQGGTP